MRSSRKLPHIRRFYSLKNIISLKQSLKYFSVDRKELVPYTLIDSKVRIYNGRKFVLNIIRSNMVNHKFGEFCITKSLGNKIHSKKKKKKSCSKIILWDI